MPVSAERVRSLTENMKPKKKKDNFADRWLGAFEVPKTKSKNSTETIKELRGSSYGKFEE